MSHECPGLVLWHWIAISIKGEVIDAERSIIFARKEVKEKFIIRKETKFRRTGLNKMYYIRDQNVSTVGRVFTLHKAFLA